jgi:hypothetical protein
MCICTYIYIYTYIYEYKYLYILNIYIHIHTYIYIYIYIYVHLHIYIISHISGLVIALMRGLAITPARFFICDDSGSMMSSDGHRVIQVNPTSHK